MTQTNPENSPKERMGIEDPIQSPIIWNISSFFFPDFLKNCIDVAPDDLDNF